MKINWKKTTYIVLDMLLAVYLVLAITAFNRPKDNGLLCEDVVIDIADENTNGFLTSNEIKQILADNHLYPKTKPMKDINPRSIEELLKNAPFVNTAECYKTEGGKVFIQLTQRTPVIRIKSINGDDYYIDERGGIMPNSKYTSDLIIATGNISRAYAKNYITVLIKYIMADDFWRNQIEQINIQNNLDVELVPRVGNHIVNIGKLPSFANKNRLEKEINAFIEKKLKRLEQFYRYGLSKVGWSIYDYINIEFDNQIICKRKADYNDSHHKPKAETIQIDTDSIASDSIKPAGNHTANTANG